MSVLVRDPDLTIHVGDVREVLASLPDESVNCVVTSPPYWGLRDYGTGAWDGGDEGCDHEPTEEWLHSQFHAKSGLAGSGDSKTQSAAAKTRWYARDGSCPSCGARRVDRQLGLEATPEEYVANMVAVFREVRRVLRRDGTCWLNLGSSYATGTDADRNPTSTSGADVPASWAGRSQPVRRHPTGYKPKDMIATPWLVALALQADGWYLRSDIVWAKPNPMPESVTDRPTKAHEYVFLLTRSPRYFFDQEAVREPSNGLWNSKVGFGGDVKKSAGDPHLRYQGHGTFHPDTDQSGRNVRSVWTIATQPYAQAHFATFPEELPRRCILAGCPEWVCSVCGKARERLTEPMHNGGGEKSQRAAAQRVHATGGAITGGTAQSSLGAGAWGFTTTGWSDCGHGSFVPGVVLDPFGGSGTTALVARRHGRRSILIELNPAYAAMAAERCQQLSLLAEGIA